MAYTDPATAVTGDLAEASFWNTSGRDNLRALAKVANGVRHVGTTPFERWYPAGAVAIYAPTTISGTIGTLFAVPFVTQRGGTLDRIGFNVSVAAGGGVARAGVYAATSDTNIYPSALVVDGGEVSTATTGIKSATISTILTPTVLYWAVLLFGTGAPTIQSLDNERCAFTLGIASAAWGGTPESHLTVAQTYGALPATYPAGGTLQTTDPPIIAIRYSA